MLVLCNQLFTATAANDADVAEAPDDAVTEADDAAEKHQGI